MKGLYNDLQWSYPDITVADGFAFISMRLQFDGRGAMCFIKRFANIAGAAFELEVILYQDAVVEHGDAGGGSETAVSVEYRSCPDDIEALPFAWFAAGVSQWDRLFVDAANLAVDICLVIIVVQYLQLISIVALAGAGEEYSAVTSGLIRSCDVGGDPVFDVQLIVGEGCFCLDITSFFIDGEDAIGDNPFCRAAIVDGYPAVEVFSIKEDGCVGGGVAACCAWGYHGWHGAVYFGGPVIGDGVGLGVGC